MGRQTAFLSHSHADADLAKRVQDFLRTKGWDIYIDWQDATMPSKPNRHTARRIQDRITELSWFLCLATANSAASRWCPWEIGFADARKGVDQVVILPARDDAGRNYGNEYLDLYRRIDVNAFGEYRLFEPDGTPRRLEYLRP